jgi:hypothetical protein
VQSGGKKAKELGSLEVNLGDFASNGTSVAKDFKFSKYAHTSSVSVFVGVTPRTAHHHTTHCALLLFA